MEESMFEFLFLMVFVGALMFTGLTAMTVFAAFGISLAIFFLFGMVGLVFKLLPWLIVIGVGYWFFKNYVYCPR
jgi:phage shock protein G